MGKLEFLANESLLDVFEYMEGCHLLRAFHRLNARFDALLITHFRSNSLDLRRITKPEFDLLCQESLPLLVDRLTSLCLSGEEKTFPQTLTLRQFSHLHSLALYKISSLQLMDRLMLSELPGLHQLVSLDLDSCRVQPEYFDNIWRLPRLVRCKLWHLPDADCEDWSFMATTVSLSLQTVILETNFPSYPPMSIEPLLAKTPRLRHLVLKGLYTFKGEQLSSIYPTIEILEYSNLFCEDELRNLAYHLPNLSHLTLTVGRTDINGRRWEKIITDWLSHLRVFRLLMTYQYTDSLVDIEERVEQLLDSFRSRFWIDEHRWFVRCHWYRFMCTDIPVNGYYLYTLPYSRRYFDIVPSGNFRSTCPHDNRLDI